MKKTSIKDLQINITKQKKFKWEKTRTPTAIKTPRSIAEQLGIR